MEMLNIRIQKESSATEITRNPIFSEKPIKVRASEKNKKATNKGTRLLNLETSQPEMGRPMRELMGMVSSRLPNSASFRPKLVLMVGILEAQDEKPKPERKKYILRAMRCFSFSFMMTISLCKYPRYFGNDKTII
jgi:hypothetical protein